MADEVKLIDRDEVGAKIQAMYIRREMDYGGENEFCRGMRKALRIIEDAPTIETEPVKHGRWINLTPMGQRAKQRMTWHGCVTWMCSECHGAARFFSEDLPYELCPHCGRIMTFGGGEEEQRAHAEYMERAAKELASEDGDSE